MPNILGRFMNPTKEPIQLIDLAKADQSQVVLFTDVDNVALKLYENLGFKPVGYLGIFFWQIL